MKKLKIEREFNVVSEKVFGAFTNPREMRVWWTEDTQCACSNSFFSDLLSRDKS